MIIKSMALAGGIAGAVALSQFPEFSQQYLQRMAGAVDELRGIVVTFDKTASDNGLTRQEALGKMQGNTFQEGLRDSIKGSMTRYETLSSNLEALRNVSPLERLTQSYRFSDSKLAKNTWKDFKPAIPVTSDGLISSIIGFLLGAFGVSTLLGSLRRLWRRPKLAT